MTIVMPVRLPGWFVRMEVRQWIKDLVKKFPMSTCSVFLVVSFFVRLREPGSCPHLKWWSPPQ